MFPEFTPQLRAAMRDEIAAFVEHVTLDARRRRQAGDAADGAASLPRRRRCGRSTACPARAPPQGPPTCRAGQRAGLLTLAGVMSVYAHPDQTGPVGRGYMVSDKLLCITPPPAPDNVDAMLPKPDPNVTTRERLEQHRAIPPAPPATR